MIIATPNFKKVSFNSFGPLLLLLPHLIVPFKHPLYPFHAAMPCIKARLSSNTPPTPHLNEPNEGRVGSLHSAGSGASGSLPVQMPGRSYYKYRSASQPVKDFAVGPSQSLTQSHFDIREGGMRFFVSHNSHMPGNDVLIIQ